MMEIRYLIKSMDEYSFLERGSDERQYCSPGIELPICGFCKSKYGKYPEYHTDKDNFDVVTQKGLEDSFKVMKNIIDAFEVGIFPKTLVLGEPQLSKRKLYPTRSALSKSKIDQNIHATNKCYCRKIVLTKEDITN